MLRLNYDSVISTWGGQGPPWTSGEPPERDIDISSWPFVSMRKSEEASRWWMFTLEWVWGWRKRS
ncbi:unnamed protein product [Brassica oleracea var. botrytis]|uniref:Uncharacterized protein n=1 Tax=Brassica oleracea TaxID=3712 RepID=A0A3P6G3N8_BRAOL|nr:unnamed protein product [Brassica oleracea]